MEKWRKIEALENKSHSQLIFTNQKGDSLRKETISDDGPIRAPDPPVLDIPYAGRDR